jgi:hypothetical protein
MTGANSAVSSASPPKPPSKIQNKTLHIRQPENGLKRPGGRSRPTPRRFASLIGTDAFVGELTRGSIGTIPATT